MPVSRPGLKLSYVHKVLLLVSVPLLFELVFVGSMAVILNKVEYEKQIVEQSRETLLSAERLYRSSYDLAQTLLIYQTTSSPAILTMCHKRIKSVNDDLVSLERQLATQKRYASYSPRIHILASQLLQAIEVLLANSSVERPALTEMLQSTNNLMPGMAMQKSLTLIPFNQRILEQIRFESKELIKQLNALCEEERLIGKKKPRSALQLRNLLETLFWIGVNGSIVLSVALAFAFNKNTTSRLKILFDNTKHLAAGEKLLPQFGGHDEIARLDDVFHQMARSLDESTERLRGVIDCIPLALVTVSDDGVIESINPRTQQYFGYNNSDIVGKPLITLLDHAQESAEQDIMTNLRNTAQTHPVEKIARRATGELFPVEMSVSQFTIADGQRWLVIIEDVTEIRQTQRMKRELTAVVSHELRTPLTSMQVFLSGLAMGAYGELKAGTEKRISGIQRSVQRLIRLINDLLDSEKMAEGQLSINCEPINIDETIVSAVDSIRELADKLQVKLVVESLNAMVNGDVDRLAQVVVNLTSNAVKFSPQGSTVRIAVCKTMDDIEVSVSDQGPGIPKEFHEIIFERFHQVQVQQNNAQKIAGTGLGLSLSKYLIEKHGGSIGVRSESGAGSTFWFRLPTLSATDPINEDDDNSAGNFDEP